MGNEDECKKTKTMIISRTAPAPKFRITIDAAVLEQVEHFTYLGQIITEDGRCEKEIRRRIIIARERFGKICSVLTNLRINIETRKIIMKCYIWSAL